MNDYIRKIISGKRKVGSKHVHSFGRRAILIFLPLAIFILLGAHPVRGETLTADDILNKVDDLYRGTSSYGMMTMEVVTAHWKRT
ncbi:MAG: hypothetical protein ABRQ32_09425, partial [Smithellaceae bacterium]